MQELPSFWIHFFLLLFRPDDFQLQLCVSSWLLSFFDYITSGILKHFTSHLLAVHIFIQYKQTEPLHKQRIISHRLPLQFTIFTQFIFDHRKWANILSQSENASIDLSKRVINLKPVRSSQGVSESLKKCYELLHLKQNDRQR